MSLIITEEKKIIREKIPQKPKIFLWFWLFLLLTIFAAYKYHEWSEYVETDENGNLRIATWREEKFLKDSLKIASQCVQYALLARENSWYPCYTCPDSTMIYLNRGEVWYYGETCNGEKGRYGNKLSELLVRYEPQFVGNKAECIIEQKRKIVNYPLLAENLARVKKLARPPANTVDN
jgi:hypothetical protein